MARILSSLAHALIYLQQGTPQTTARGAGTCRGMFMISRLRFHMLISVAMVYPSSKLTKSVASRGMPRHKRSGLPKI